MERPGLNGDANQDSGVAVPVLTSSTLLSRYGYFWLQKNKMVTVLVPSWGLQSGSPQTNTAGDYFCQNATNVLLDPHCFVNGHFSQIIIITILGYNIPLMGLLRLVADRSMMPQNLHLPFVLTVAFSSSAVSMYRKSRCWSLFTTTTSWAATTPSARPGSATAPQALGYATGQTCWPTPGVQWPSGTRCSQRRRWMLRWRPPSAKHTTHTVFVQHHLHRRDILSFVTRQTWNDL